MRLLLVESDPIESKTTIHILRQGGFTVDAASTGQDAIEMLRHYDYDLAVTGSSSEEFDASEIIRRARSAKIDTPIVVLSRSDNPRRKVAAFNAGADDYIVKPVAEEELIARLQAVLRRSRGFATAVIHLGPLAMDLNAKTALVNGHPVSLTGKEYAILELLVLRRGIVLTKDAFLNHLYGGIDEPEMKIIDVFICKLRRKLQQYGADGLISTVWGRGYVLREDYSPVPHEVKPDEASLMNA